MLRVTVEVVPGGDNDRARQIAEIDVWNDRGDIDEADYKWEAKLEGGKGYEGEVLAHRRKHGWAPLIERVLLDMRAAQSAERTFPERFAELPSERQGDG